MEAIISNNNPDLKAGSVVSVKSHEHLMTLSEITADEGKCLYFIGTELHTETHKLEGLTFIRE